MTEGASEARPRYAITAWVDDVNLYVELPGTPPYVTTFALTEGGLSKALHLMKQSHQQSRTGRYIRPSLAKHTSLPAPFTETQRQNTRDVLRRMKIA